MSYSIHAQFIIGLNNKFALPSLKFCRQRIFSYDYKLKQHIKLNKRNTGAHTKAMKGKTHSKSAKSEWECLTLCFLIFIFSNLTRI